MSRILGQGLTLAMLTLVVFVAGTCELSVSTAFAQKRYREDPRQRKSKARDALIKAMSLNAQVELLLRQNSDRVNDMVQMLGQSYGFQVTAIAQGEGLVREASFKDPMLDRGILDMYEHGKPATMMAQTQIKTGDYSGALQSLDAAKRAHKRYMILLY